MKNQTSRQVWFNLCGSSSHCWMFPIVIYTAHSHILEFIKWRKVFVECSRLSNIICGIAKKTLIVRLLIKVDYTLGTGLLFSVFFMGNRFYDSTQRNAPWWRCIIHIIIVYILSSQNPKLNAAKNSMIYYDNYVFVFSYEKSSTINCSLHTSCIF